jgi:hypothetical protein
VVPGAGSLTLSPHDAIAAAIWNKDGAPQNPQLLNRYIYVNNNPLRYTDPTGHCVFGIDTVVCIAVIGSILIGGTAYLALDSAVRYAQEHPTNWCDYTTCLPANSDQSSSSNAITSENSGNTAPAGPAPTPTGNNDPWEAKLFKPSYSEQQKNQVRTLTERWDEGTYSSKAHSIVDHSTRHGYGDNYIKYLMDAAGFNTRGATPKVLDAVTNTVRYNKRSGEFIIYRDGKIVSYGWNP